MLSRETSALIPASFQSGNAWFAVAVRDHRKATVGITELGFALFCPMEKKSKVRRGKRIATENPVFPGYLFVQFERSADEWGNIDHVDGVMGILRNGLFPLRIPDADIERLRMAEAMGVFDKTRPPRIGLAVEAIEGPFAGWVGKIVRARTQERVDVLLSFLGRMVEANMPLMALKEA